MIQLHVPPKYADAVREALAPCDGRCDPYSRAFSHRPDCGPPSFWWGITAEWDHAAHQADVEGRDHYTLPDDVQQMLNPCPTCDGTGRLHDPDASHDRFDRSCPDCRDGRPLVELVTDCPRCSGGVGFWRGNAWCDGPCATECALGIVSLGVVTATNVLPIDECDDWCIIYEPDATHAIHLTGVQT